MSKKVHKPIRNAVADAPDMRDRFYEPRLKPLKKEILQPGPYILDQENEGACTGFGLAAVINQLYRAQGENNKVSPRMLYEMARRYDEWAGENYEGSSCRGAIKGWINSGVCLDELCPYVPGQQGLDLTLTQLEDAKSRTVGAYYRIRPEITDMHSALNETGVVYASASVHDGWNKPIYQKGVYIIEKQDDKNGGHAFAIVGYNDRGFWVQNSWGEDWGNKGIALWLYEDWIENVYDAWVVQLSLSTPQIFDLSKNAGRASEGNHSKGSAPSRSSIWKHFIHLDDGHFHSGGKYWSNEGHIHAIAENMLQHQDEFDHVMLYGHGGLNSTKDSARRVSAMKDVFLKNRIYPLHFMYDTGLMEEIKDITLGKKKSVEGIAGGITDWFDRRIEGLTRKPGRALWREMKQGAEKPFEQTDSDGTKALNIIFNCIQNLNDNKKVHLIGHSTGAILHAHLLSRLFKDNIADALDSCSLLAPAASYTLFKDTYKKFMADQLISDVAIYNLSEKFEKDDNVAFVYRKSLLYLVSNAFEEEKGDDLLGMKIFNDDNNNGAATIFYSPSDTTQSKSHGGFDNDETTMNHVLSRMLNGNVTRAFSKDDLKY